jgi:hypothetical protein
MLTTTKIQRLYQELTTLEDTWRANNKTGGDNRKKIVYNISHGLLGYLIMDGRERLSKKREREKEEK